MKGSRHHLRFLVNPSLLCIGSGSPVRRFMSLNKGPHGIFYLLVKYSDRNPNVLLVDLTNDSYENNLNHLIPPKPVLFVPVLSFRGSEFQPGINGQSRRNLKICLIWRLFWCKIQLSPCSKKFVLRITFSKACFVAILADFRLFLLFRKNKRQSFKEFSWRKDFELNLRVKFRQ